VLIVEDDPTTSGALRAILARRGLAVQVAATLAEAHEILDSHAPHWLILDLMLPDGDGIALLKRVRRSGDQIRIAVTTGVSDPVMLKNASDSDPDLLLIKPIHLDLLLTALADRI
jgi:DNA-binding response OmpR family regulator